MRLVFGEQFKFKNKEYHSISRCLMDSGKPNSHFLKLLSTKEVVKLCLWHWKNESIFNLRKIQNIISNNKNKKNSVVDRSDIKRHYTIRIRFTVIKMFYSPILCCHMQWFCVYLFCYLVSWASIKWNSVALFESDISGPTLLKTN